MTATTATDLVKEAKSQIENLTTEQLEIELPKQNVILIDLRESEEIHLNGKIHGSVNAPRGMLEFYADSALPYHRPEFDKNKRIILYCASGGRSALAVKTFLGMGYSNVAHLDGGIKGWAESGRPVER